LVEPTQKGADESDWGEAGKVGGRVGRAVKDARELLVAQFRGAQQGVL